MKNQSKETIKIYLNESWKYKFSGFVALFGVVGASIMTAIVPLQYRDFFNVLTLNKIGDQKTINRLLSILLFIFIFKIITWAFWRISVAGANKFQTKVMALLGNKCFKYLHKHSFTYFSNTFTGSIVKKVKGFVNSFESISDQVLWDLLPLIVGILSIIFILFGVNIFLCLGIILWIIMFLSINWIFTQYKIKYEIKRTEAETITTGVLADTVTNSTNIKLFNGYNFEVEGFARVTENLRKLKYLTWSMEAIFDAVQSLLMIGLEIGIIYFSIKFWNKKLLTVGDFVLIQTYLGNIFIQMRNFGKIVRKIYGALADANEMTEIFQTKHEIRDIKNAKELVVNEGKIQFKNVDFKYEKGKMLLENLKLTIKPNERVALIGPSGAGKTTIIKLLLRMHNLTGGKILIDGQNIAKVTQESLREAVSLVPQDPILFHRTLMENIRYGKPDATDKEVIEAAKAANAHEFISELVSGYETYVGERGIKLSGGERQRVAIARAILRNAPILILDEATSSLDSESETLIQEALDRLMKEKTVIVIAHRLSTIKKANRIIVVNKGSIVEQGTHEELLNKQSSIYKKLWNLQVGGFIK